MKKLALSVLIVLVLPVILIGCGGGGIEDPVSHTGMIIVTSPTGSDTWKIGQTRTVTWTTSGSLGFGGSVELRTADNSKVFILTPRMKLADNNFAWSVGYTGQGNPPLTEGGKYKIRVIEEMGVIFGESQVFTVIK